MAMNENIVTGRKYRIATDNTGENWDRISLWTSASDVEFNNGQNAERVVSELNRLKDVSTVTLPADGWTNTLPYTQTVTVSRLRSTDSPVITRGIPSDQSSAGYAALRKAYSCIDRAVVNNGSITFYCCVKKPTTEIKVFVKGV